MQSRGVHGDEAASAEPNGARRRASRTAAAGDRKPATYRRASATSSGAGRTRRNLSRGERGRTASPTGVTAQLVTLLQEQLHDLRRRLDETERERLELAQLLAMTAGTLADLARRLADGSGPPPQAQPSTEHPATLGAPRETRTPNTTVGWWQRVRTGKRGLGAGLTLLGAAGVLAGIGFRVAMELHAIEGRASIAYVVGAAGFLVLLVGLALVY